MCTPALSGPVLSGHPLLSGQLSKSQNSLPLITVILTSIKRSPHPQGLQPLFKMVWRSFGTRSQPRFQALGKLWERSCDRKTKDRAWVLPTHRPFHLRLLKPGKLCSKELFAMAGLQYHAIKNKYYNHSMN